jgi:hypothetical protein
MSSEIGHSPQPRRTQSAEGRENYTYRSARDIIINNITNNYYARRNSDADATVAPVVIRDVVNLTSQGPAALGYKYTNPESKYPAPQDGLDTQTPEELDHAREQEVLASKAAKVAVPFWSLPSDADKDNAFSSMMPTLVKVFDTMKDVPAILVSKKLASYVEEAVDQAREYETAVAESKVVSTMKSRGDDGLDDPITKTKEQSRISADKVISLLADFWIKAGLLPPNEQASGVVVTSPVQQDHQETTPLGRQTPYQPEWPEGWLRSPTIEGFAPPAPDESHTIKDAMLENVVNQARGLIRARDYHEDFCYNYDRECGKFVRTRRPWDSRRTSIIQQEFSRRFVPEVHVGKVRLQDARQKYTEAQRKAREAGIPELFLGYVESVDVWSEDTEEIDHDDFDGVNRVPQRRIGLRNEVLERELYPPRQRVADWRIKIAPTSPLQNTAAALDSSPNFTSSSSHDDDSMHVAGPSRENCGPNQESTSLEKSTARGVADEIGKFPIVETAPRVKRPEQTSETSLNTRKEPPHLAAKTSHPGSPAVPAHLIGAPASVPMASSTAGLEERTESQAPVASTHATLMRSKNS